MVESQVFNIYNTYRGVTNVWKKYWFLITYIFKSLFSTIFYICFTSYSQDIRDMGWAKNKIKR